MSGPQPRVIVVVEGGVVSAIYSDSRLNVDVLDHDNWKATDRNSCPEEWLRLEALAKEIDESSSLQQVL
jgi:hypothetical protein